MIPTAMSSNWLSFFTLLVWINSAVCWNNFTSTNDLSRQPRSPIWPDTPGPFAPAGLTADGEVRAPILMEISRDLTKVNGPTGLFGVCTRVYRVLHDTNLKAAEECRRHRNSRQSVLGDITEFYHTLIDTGSFNQTIEFPLADRFKRFSFRASFMYLPSRGNEPAVLIESPSKSSKVLCVESIKCPQPETTSAPSVSSTLANVPLVPSSNGEEETTTSSAKANSPLRGASDDEANAPFWDTLLAGTEPRSWFLSTISLSALCVILLLILLCTWLYICWLRRKHARQRCHGTCRFGCRCPADVIRQTVNNAAVCGPLDSHNAHLLGSPLTPQGNGSIRSGSGFGAHLFSGGTMTSSRWGSNGGQKLSSPIYMSLANAQEKAALLGQNCVLQPTANPMTDLSNGTWAQTTNQRASAHMNRRRLSQDVICRSTSDGSSVSGLPMSNGNNKHGGPLSRLPLSTYSAAGGQVNGLELPITSTNMRLNGSRMDPVYYPSHLVGYNTGMRNGSPSMASSPPSRTDGGRRSNGSSATGGGGGPLDRVHLNSNSTGTMVAEADEHLDDEVGQQVLLRVEDDGGGRGPADGLVTCHIDQSPHNGGGAPYYRNSMEKMRLSPHNSADTCGTFNGYIPSDPMLQTNPYSMRGSDTDALNITPPSGFYDASGHLGDPTTTGLRSGGPSINSSSFGTRSFLYPMLANPTVNQSTEESWRNPSVSLGTHNGHHNGHHNGQDMVGIVDVDGVSRGQLMTGQRKPDSGPPVPSKPLLSPRIYAASERML